LRLKIRSERLQLGERKRTSAVEATMGQIVGVVGSGILFLSFCAYCEARDVLRSTGHGISPGRAQLGGALAAGLTVLAGAAAICYLFLANGSVEGGAF
jgi:hypothetical protein